MSEDQLYAVARQRIDRRNRRLTLWALNLGVLILSLAALILLGSTLAAAIFMAIAGIFALHSILLGLAESREKDIEKEVARLRAVADEAYEKPKRLELTEDGELVDLPDSTAEHSLKGE
jgi:hypothetical protein